MFRPEGAEAEAEDDTAGAGRRRGRRGGARRGAELTGVYRASGTNPSGSEYPASSRLRRTATISSTWWIGKDEFHGSGHYAGKMLVINWGGTTPVVYSFSDEGALDGEWADGSASETLTPVGTAASADDDVAPPEGEYRSKAPIATGEDY